MESIQELRKKLQTDVLGHPYLQRILSVYLTRLFLLTNISANQVTVLMLLFGLVGAAAFFLGYYYVGFLLLYLNILLDAVDGEVARYRGVFSLRGIYLDIINHLAVPGLFFLGLTVSIGGLLSQPSPLFIIAGVLGAFALPVLRANGDIHKQLFVQPFRQNPQRFIPGAVAAQQSSPSDTVIPKPARRLREIVYHLYHFAPMLVVFFVAFIAEELLYPEATSHSILIPLMLAYSALFWAYLIRRVITGFYRIDGEVASLADGKARWEAHG